VDEASLHGSCRLSCDLERKLAFSLTAFLGYAYELVVQWLHTRDVAKGFL